MTEIYVQEKQVVVPGEVLARGMECIPSQGTYRDGEAVVASRLGLINISGKVFKIIPLSGVYEPKRGDVVIGNVVDVLLHGWRIDLKTTYSAMLSLKDGTTDFVARGADLTQYFCLGDYVIASVINVTSQKLIDLSMRGPGLKKLTGGRILKVNPHKVPRIIGKRGSMVSMIKAATDCKILVGQNGLIWINGEPEQEVLAIETIKMIEDQAHLSGLTDKMKQHLEKVTGKSLDNLEASHDEYVPHPGQSYGDRGERSDRGFNRERSFDRRGNGGGRFSQNRPFNRDRPQGSFDRNRSFDNNQNQGSFEQQGENSNTNSPAPEGYGFDEQPTGNENSDAPIDSAPKKNQNNDMQEDAW